MLISKLRVYCPVMPNGLFKRLGRLAVGDPFAVPSNTGSHNYGRCQFARDNKRCHEQAKTVVAYGIISLMKVCWPHADEMMRELGERHVRDGHEEEAREGYARFKQDMERAIAEGY